MLYDLFSEFFDDSFSPFIAEVRKSSVPDKTCPKCRQTLSEFSRTGKLGCPECFNAFRPYLLNVLKSIHGSGEHTGKISKNADKKLKAERELKRLKTELEEAILKQEFEKAAVLRDKIAELDNKEVR